MDKNKIYIVVLNWNGATDTVACLDSLVQLNVPRTNIIVCDNHSSDGSDEIIKYHFINSISSQQLGWRDYNFVKMRLGDDLPVTIKNSGSSFVILVRTTHNLGFAGGVNVGLRIALQDPSMKYVWILNNDTVVDKGALQSLVDKMKSDQTVGICGSTLLYFDQPELIQAVGGTYNSWLGTTRHMLGQQFYSAELCHSVNPSDIDYQVGASLFVRRELLEQVGVLSEDYFLYCEELDWVYRMKRATPKFQLGYAPDSLVFHKEGASTGSNDLNGKTYSYFSDYFYMTSRMKFSKKYHPFRYWLVRFSLIGLGINRLRRHQYRSLMLAICLFIGWVPSSIVPKYDGMNR
jgi:GT2 family glycosyltransferase